MPNLLIFYSATLADGTNIDVMRMGMTVDEVKAEGLKQGHQPLRRENILVLDIDKLNADTIYFKETTMGEPNWSEAPEGAQWWNGNFWYKKAGRDLYYWRAARGDWRTSRNINPKKNWINRPTSEKKNMNKPSWSEAPEGAQWWCPLQNFWYKRGSWQALVYRSLADDSWYTSDYDTDRPHWIKRPISEKKTMTEQEQYKRLSNIYLRLSKGDELQYKGAFVGNTVLHLGLNLENYTTAKKEHPLQCLVGTDIFCYFRNEHNNIIGIDRLKEIAYHGKKFGGSWRTIGDYCEPVKNVWFNWSGGPCPVPKGMGYKVRFRNGVEDMICDHRWEYTGENDIIAVMFLEDG
jgi:hypothetical protein